MVHRKGDNNVVSVTFTFWKLVLTAIPVATGLIVFFVSMVDRHAENVFQKLMIEHEKSERAYIDAKTDEKAQRNFERITDLRKKLEDQISALSESNTEQHRIILESLHDIARADAKARR